MFKVNPTLGQVEGNVSSLMWNVDTMLEIEIDGIEIDVGN